MLAWAPQALIELESIALYIYTQIQDVDIASSVVGRIQAKCEWLATHTSAGSKVIGLDKSFKLSYAIKTSYKIWYQIHGIDHIKILRIQNSRMQEPTPEEIEERS